MIYLPLLVIGLVARGANHQHSLGHGHTEPGITHCRRAIPMGAEILDPVNLIVSALGAGLGVAVKDTTTQAIKDGVSNLKALINRRLAGKPEVEKALVQFEENPNEGKEALREALVRAGVDQDSEIIEEARKLLTLVQPQQMGLGKYNTQFAGPVYGVAQGDNANVTMTFGDTPPRNRE
jgi:hypothetical protein